MSLHPPIPVADGVTAPFWEAVAAHRLVVQRCSECQQFQHPPAGTCTSCTSSNLTFEEVSGRARVHSFTETVSGARHPYFQSVAPYLVGHVELVEQEGIYMASNFPGSTFDDMAVGALTQVEYQQIAPEAVIPQFRLLTERA